MDKEILLSTIINQLPDMEERELRMVTDYIKGLKDARNFLSRG